jgi:prepilin-type processing-associated H-X9-DG protein/prepilin-type N-terminal cleavage/methylation domain-containing protein
VTRRIAFTLVELLVVLGIIAVLAGLALSSFSGAREAARTAVCLSNLRQMAAAATDYAVANDGSYPPAQWVDPADPAVLRGWDFAKRGGTVTGPGFLWGPRPVTAVQQCPAFDGKAQSIGDVFTGYNYNTSYVGRGTGEGAPARVARVKQPARTALLGDGQWSLGANKYMRSPLRSPTEESFTYADGGPARAAGTQGYRHRGATNVAFCDGHAETLRARFTAGNSHVAEGTGFLSEDNSLYDLE